MAPRTLLLCLDDSDSSEEAVLWTMEHLYHPGDELHIVHVIPRLQLTHLYGAASVDFLPQQDPAAYEALIEAAEGFIQRRALAHIGEVEPPPVVHLVKYEVDADSIGNVICRKEDELLPAVTVLARHSKSKLQSFFLGSVSNYVIHHSKRPILVAGAGSK